MTRSRTFGRLFLRVVMPASFILISAITFENPARAICDDTMITGKPASGAELSGIKALARKNWRQSVAARKGPSWSHWNAAKSRSLDCRKRAGGRSQCQARGTPCKDVSGGGKASAGERYELVR